jgi:predicted dehydrogenase/threonine dehydrogenase-like Zn-dependent dehydrogenase
LVEAVYLYLNQDYKAFQMSYMKQLVIKKGSPVVVNVPPPSAVPGFILVEVRASCVSPGTEMAGIAASGRSLLQRIMAQPDKAKAALGQMRSQGISAVWNKALQTLEKESGCGYSAAGVVLDVGPGVTGFHVGMRVAVTGAGHANHAELVAIPVNLAVAIPDGLGFAEASSVALGAIAMQGVRRAGVSLGERVAVIGCGPLGLLALQMLKAAGCKVFATDLDEGRLEIARRLGATATANPASEDIVKRAMHWSDGRGVDAVLVFAATSSPEPLSQAFRMSRRKGRVVLVGVAGNEYKRDDMYAKELDFLVSTSYGPGRYDDSYELAGQDYPFGYVRWTENRNMAAYLDLLAGGAVDVASLITVKERLEDAPAAYERLKAPDRPLLAVLECGPSNTASSGENPPASAGSPQVEGTGRWQSPAPGQPLGIALIGAGSFVQGMHVPLLKAMTGKVSIPWSCSRTGLSARNSASMIPGCKATTRYDEVLADPAVHAVLIGTRHDTHAALAIQALQAGKAVFLEKPMCLTAEEREALRAAVEASDAPFMIGYNRRFSPFAEKIRRESANRIHPLMIQYTMNAGYLPGEHWTQGPEGGGRLLGEACHIIDLFRSLIGHPVQEISCTPLRSNNPAAFATDNFSLTLSYEDGSVANLIYTALGHKDVAKERMQVFFDEKTFLLEDYLTLRAHGSKNAGMELKIQDKGHGAELAAFAAAACGGQRFPIPWEELMETWEISHHADRICRFGE